MNDMTEIRNIDYNDYVDLVGTAHFTRRSLDDAYRAIRSLKPHDVALELDWNRFRLLNASCVGCSERGSCRGICEFTGAAEALGNIDANVWLIDMTEREMRQRIRSRMTPFEMSRIAFSPYGSWDQDPVRLWERGFKDRVISNTKRQIEASRRFLPSVWRVLIDERNALMAGRLARIVTRKLDEERKPKILTFVGAAHVEGMRELLSNPLTVKEDLRRLGVPFTEPALIRRVAVQED